MVIPDDMIEVCGEVFSGEYEIDYLKQDAIILDIGAGVGAFTRWAKYRWVDSTIYAYEPDPNCYKYLEKNVEDLEKVFIHKSAVGSESGVRRLYLGGNSRAMNSFEKPIYTLKEGVDVQVIGADTLPKADIVKCDTEGAEIEILENLPYNPHVVLVEYHSLENKSRLEQMYADRYMLFEYKLGTFRTGILKFVREDIVPR